jgi:hypothetical protein
MTDAIPIVRGRSLAHIASTVGLDIEPCRKCDRRTDGWRRLLFWRRWHPKRCAVTKEQRQRVLEAVTLARVFRSTGREDQRVAGMRDVYLVLAGDE